ncbi:MAG: hypothetical protein ABI234_15890 [Ktedonobacteraceae bacterium]
MSAQAQTVPQKSGRGGRLFLWISGIVSFSLLGYFFLQITYQIIVPPAASRLILVQDVPLPDGLFPNVKNPLAPGVEEMFDGFDFQTYDATSHRLFIAHTGPGPDLLAQAKIKFDPKNDGNIVVFDTQLNKVIARLPITQVAGIIDAPDLHKIYAAGVDSDDNGLDSIFDIDTDTLQFHVIHLTLNESPDAITYDSVDHRIFVSDPAAPPDITGPQNPDRQLMDVAVINALNDKIITRINFGSLPLLSGETAPTNPANIPAYGHDVGHSDYDPTLGHVYVATQILPNADDPNPYILPPPHTGEIAAINAATMRIDQRIQLPAYCGTPHGMAVDPVQHVAFVACTDFDTAAGLFENLIRINLRTMTVIPADPTTMRLAPGPDLVRLDASAHLLFVASAGGITIFDETPGNFHRLGAYAVARQSHTIAINEQTQQMYFPTFSGGRPVLRIERYNPNGR